MAPTPVTVSAITVESGSTRNAISTRKLPTPIHSNSETCDSRRVPGLDPSVPKTVTARPKATATAAEASHPADRPRHRGPVSRRTAAPARGIAGMSGARMFIRSPLQQARVVHVGAPPLPIQRHDDGQADHHLAGADHQGEERQN